MERCISPPLGSKQLLSLPQLAQNYLTSACTGSDSFSVIISVYFSSFRFRTARSRREIPAQLVPCNLERICLSRAYFHIRKNQLFKE